MAVRSFRRGRTGPSRPTPWYEGRGADRFRHDDALIKKHSPGLRWEFADGRARLVGTLTIIEAGGLATDIATRIEFPEDYPRSEPLAFDSDHRFPWEKNRHYTDDGRCCLWLPPCSKWNPNDLNALGPLLDEVVVFFYRQLLFDATQRWAGPAFDHGVFGYWEFLTEELGGQAEARAFWAGITWAGTTRGRNERCPCGRPKHFKRCHWRVHQALARRIPRSEMKRLRTLTPDELDARLRSRGQQ